MLGQRIGNRECGLNGRVSWACIVASVLGLLAIHTRLNEEWITEKALVAGTSVPIFNNECALRTHPVATSKRDSLLFGSAITLCDHRDR